MTQTSRNKVSKKNRNRNRNRNNYSNKSLLQTVEDIKKKGNAAYGKGKYKEALSFFEQAIKLKADYTPAWHNKGATQIQLQLLDDAIITFQKLLQLDPQHIKGLYNIANIYYKQKKFPEALEILCDLLKIAPKDMYGLKLKERCADQVAAKIFYAVVDLKFTKNQKVKILEFGVGTMSGTSSYDQVHQNSMREQFINHMSKKSIPTYLNSCFGVRGHDDSLFIDQLNPKVEDEMTRFDSKRISGYRAVYAGSDRLSTDEGILHMDDSLAAVMMCQDKQVMHEIMIASANTQDVPYRPKTRKYPLRYNKSLSKRIQRDIPSKYYALKKPAGARGEGVEIVSAKDLDKKLRQLLHSNLSNQAKRIAQEIKNNRHYSDNPTELFQKMMQKALKASSWNAGSSGTPFFLVEAYTPSQYVKYKKKRYDATMRVFFMIERDNHKIKFSPLGAVWKLPPKPIGQGKLRERTVSSYTAQHRIAVAVNKQIQKQVYQQLDKILSNLFSYVFTYDIHQYTAQFTRKQCSNIEKKYGFYLLAYLANSYITSGKYYLAADMLNQADRLLSNEQSRNRVLYERGLLHTRKGEYQQALRVFTRAMMSGSPITQTQFRRGCVFAKLGNFKAAINDFNTSSMNQTMDMHSVYRNYASWLNPHAVTFNTQSLSMIIKSADNDIKEQKEKHEDISWKLPYSTTSLLRGKCLDKVVVFDKHPAFGGKRTDLTPKGFYIKFGCTYFEGLQLPDMFSYERYMELCSRAVVSLTNDMPFRAVYERLQKPLSSMGIMYMGKRVGYGLIALEKIPMGTVLCLYSGKHVDRVLTTKEKEYSLSQILSNSCGGIARFMQHLPVSLEGEIEYFSQTTRNPTLFSLEYNVPLDQAKLSIADKQKMSELRKKKTEELRQNNDAEFGHIDFTGNASLRSQVATANVRTDRLLFDNFSVVIMIAMRNINKNDLIGFNYGRAYWLQMDKKKTPRLLFDKKGRIIDKPKLYEKDTWLTSGKKMQIAPTLLSQFQNGLLGNEDNFLMDYMLQNKGKFNF